MAKKLEYTLRLLDDKLRQEKADLMMWNRFLENCLLKDEYSIRQAKGNISSCTHRIEELEISIDLIKNYTPSL